MTNISSDKRYGRRLNYESVGPLLLRLDNIFHDLFYFARHVS